EPGRYLHHRGLGVGPPSAVPKRGRVMEQPAGDDEPGVRARPDAWFDEPDLGDPGAPADDDHFQEPDRERHAPAGTGRAVEPDRQQGQVADTDLTGDWNSGQAIDYPGPRLESLHESVS